MNLSNIQQYLDGSVRISFYEKFRRHLTLEELPTPSETPSSIPTTRKDINLLSKTSTQSVKLKGIMEQGQVSHPCYEPNEETLESDGESHVSPTQSDFEAKPQIHHQLRVIKKHFEIDWDTLTNDFNSNKIKKKELRSSHSKKEVLKLMSKWENFMLEIQTNIKFYDWYEKYHNQCNVISKNQWVKEDMTTVSSSHPPLKQLILIIKTL